MPSNLTSQTKGKLTVGNILASATAAALAIVGTLFYTNLTSTREYTTVASLQTVPYQVVTQTGSTATGGLLSGGAQGNYQAITIDSPMSTANAALNGLATGTGVINEAYVEATAPQGGTITCSVAATPVRGTGGVIVISRKTFGTGTVAMNLTGAVIIGPNESFRCSTNPTPSAGFSAKALLKITPTRLTN